MLRLHYKDNSLVGREKLSRRDLVGLRHHITWLKFPKVNKEKPWSVCLSVGGCMLQQSLCSRCGATSCPGCENSCGAFSFQFYLRQKADELKHETVSNLQSVRGWRWDAFGSPLYISIIVIIRQYFETLLLEAVYVYLACWLDQVCLMLAFKAALPWHHNKQLFLYAFCKKTFTVWLET